MDHRRGRAREVEPRRGSISSSALAASAVVLLTVLASFAARLWIPPFFDGATFPPFPDGLEAVASAQSIAQDGRFLLHVGPNTVRPRYSPGFPLLLAGFLRLGLPADRLILVVATCDAAIAGVAALGALALMSYLARSDGFGPPSASAWVGAGLVAGVPFALAMFPALVGKMLHSDPATNLATLLALGCGGLALGTSRLRSRYFALAFVGALGAWVLTARPIDGVLLGVGSLPLMWRAIRTWSRQELLVSSWVLLAGALVPVLFTLGLLVASGLSPLHWTGYAFWLPELFEHPHRIFGIRFALQPSGYPVLGGGPAPGVLVSSSMLLGIPKGGGLGWAWPTLGWVALYIARRRIEQLPRTSASEAVRALLAAGLLWSLARALFFPFYFYPSERFYLGPLALVAAGTGFAFGVLWNHSRRSLRLAALLLLAGILWDSWSSLALRLADHREKPESSRPRLLAEFEAWKELTPQQRRQRRMPFDPLQAQALGSLDRESIEGMQGWGRLPETYHFQTLRRLGVIQAEPRRRP